MQLVVPCATSRPRSSSTRPSAVARRRPRCTTVPVAVMVAAGVDAAHVVHVQVGGGVRLARRRARCAPRTPSPCRAASPRCRRARCPSGWSCRRASRAWPRRRRGRTRVSVKPTSPGDPRCRARRPTGPPGPGRARSSARHLPPPRHGHRDWDLHGGVAPEIVTPPGRSRHATTAPISATANATHDARRSPWMNDSCAASTNRCAAAPLPRPRAVSSAAPNESRAPAATPRHLVRERVAEAGGGDAAHHRHAQRAADLAGRVVDRRSDAGLRRGHRAHDRRGGRRDQEAHAEGERHLAEEDDPVARVGVDAMRSSCEPRHDHEPDHDRQPLSEPTDDARA